MTVRIVVADDHAIVREGLKQILSAQPDFEIVFLAPAPRADQA